MIKIEKNIPLDVQWLKNNCQMIHYFGLGFIQLKIDNEYRLHFYTKKLPPIVPEEDIHNHRYDFVSRILKGSLVQEIYDVKASTVLPTHYMQDESCQPDKEAKPIYSLCSVKLLIRQVFVAGSEYWIDSSTFHRVHSESAITLLRRTDYKKEMAQVIRSCQETSHVCPFSKKVDEGTLWGIVEECVK